MLQGKRKREKKEKRISVNIQKYSDKYDEE